MICSQIEKKSPKAEELQRWKMELIKRESFYDEFCSELFEDKKFIGDLKAKAQNPATSNLMLKYPSRQMLSCLIRRVSKDPITISAKL